MKILAWLFSFQAHRMKHNRSLSDASFNQSAPDRSMRLFPLEKPVLWRYSKCGN